MALFNKFFGKNTQAQQPSQRPSPEAAQAKPATPAPEAAPVKSAAPKPAPKPAPETAGADWKTKPLPCDAWLVFKGAPKEYIVKALQMTNITPCTWDDGIRGCSGPESRLFVTAPINGCCLIIGSTLPDLAYRTRAATWITEMGKYIPKIYSFACQKNVQVFAFAQVEGRELKRIYAVAQGSVRLNKGDRSDGEEALGYNFPSNDDELFEPMGLTTPGEHSIRMLADYWGLDPAQAVGKGGILGTVPKI